MPECRRGIPQPKWLVGLMLLLLAVDGRAADKWSGRVRLVVSSDKETEGNIVSYYGRYLRSLGDITLVESEPTYTISVVAIKTTTGLYAISTTVYRKWDIGEFLLWYLKSEHVKDSVAELASKSTEEAVKVEGHYLRTAGIANLATLCENQITEIDKDVFQPIRDAQRRIDEYIEQVKKKNEKGKDTKQF